MKQTVLARLIGVSQASISRYLHGINRPRPKVARKLEKETGIKLEIWLFAEKEELKKIVHSKGIQLR